MKAADIPDETILSIVREFNEGRAPDKFYPAREAWPGTPGAFTISAWTNTGPRWALMWDLTERLTDFPEKVIRAKCRQLIKRGLLDGCTCGCRGDFEIPDVRWGTWRDGPDFIAEAIRATQ